MSPTAEFAMAVLARELVISLFIISRNELGTRQLMRPGVHIRNQMHQEDRIVLSQIRTHEFSIFLANYIIKQSHTSANYFLSSLFELFEQNAPKCLKTGLPQSDLS